MPHGETYLGDGLYASYDAAEDMIKLRAPRPGREEAIYLERSVFIEFLRFAETCFPSIVPSESPSKEYCTYPQCKCIVHTSSSRPIHECPKGLEPSPSAKGKPRKGGRRT